MHKRCYDIQVTKKSAIGVARQLGNKKKNFNREQQWSRGYAVSTVGFEEEMIQKYMKNQERLDRIGSDEMIFRL